MADEKRVDRRRFFRAAMSELFKPLERKAAPLQRAIEEFSRLHETEAKPTPPPAPSAALPAPLVRAPEGRVAARRSQLPVAPVWLRPPGALPEEQFKSACSMCAECVVACPVQAIRLEPGSRGDGLPFIDVDLQPCVVCDGLHCMHRCPSGALVPTPVAEIKMGTATWHPATCVRSRHEECTTCLEVCPVGSSAIELRDGRIHVLENGCVGCGVCEHHCPTVPKSITVTPRSADAG